MIRYTTLKKKPKEFLALTGLTLREFKKLLPAFEQAWHKTPTAPKKRRKRAPGGGRKASLSTAADRLVFILIYVKTYPLQIVQAQLFGISQPSANRYIHQFLPVLAQALDGLGVMPKREGAEMLALPKEAARAHDLIVDGVERRRQRPQDPKIQAIHYSGKKKMHADKNSVVVNTRTKQVNFLGQTLAGSVHDKTAVEHAQISYPAHTKLRSDLGFLGYHPTVQEHLQPQKSPSTKS